MVSEIELVSVDTLTVKILIKNLFLFNFILISRFTAALKARRTSRPGQKVDVALN